MTQPDKYYMEVEQKPTTLSLAVRLVDDYAATSDLVGNVTVFLTENNKAAIKNLSGYYIFTDLPTAMYELNIASDYYLDQKIVVSAGDPHNAVKRINLIPTSVYPFLTNATLIRGLVVGQGAGVLAGAMIKATNMVPESSIKAKVGPAGGSIGDTDIVMVDITGQLISGDTLMIKDTNGSRVEFCTIAVPLPANPVVDPYKLAMPLKFNHAAGTAMHYLNVDSVLHTKTTLKGEFVIYFSRTKTPRFITRVAISQINYKTDERELAVSEGALVSLGRIQLVP